LLCVALAGGGILPNGIFSFPAFLLLVRRIRRVVRVRVLVVQIAYLEVLVDWWVEREAVGASVEDLRVEYGVSLASLRRSNLSLESQMPSQDRRLWMVQVRRVLRIQIVQAHHHLVLLVELGSMVVAAAKERMMDTTKL